MQSTFLKKTLRSLFKMATLAVTLGSLPSFAYAQTVAEAVKSAVDTHPSSAAACFNERALFQSMIVARGALLPQATFSGAVGREEKDNFTGVGSSNVTVTRLDYRTMTFTVSQLLFDGNATKNIYCAAQKRRNAGHFDNLSVREQLALNTATSYLDIIQFRQIKKLSEHNVGVHKDVMENAKRRYSGGAGQKADLELVQARLALAESRLEGFQTQLENSIATFFELTGMRPQTLIIPTIPDTVIPMHLDEIGYCANPQIQSAVAQMQATKHDAFAASSQFLYPVIEGNLNFTRGDNIAGNAGYQSDLQGFVSATYNIYQGGSQYARVQETCARRFQAREQLISTQQFVEKNGTIAWNNIQSAIMRIKELTDYVTNLSQVLTAYYKQYDLGQRSMLNLLDIENELFNAKVSLVTEEISKLTAAYQLISTTGKLENTILDESDTTQGIEVENIDAPVSNRMISSAAVPGVNPTTPTNSTPGATPLTSTNAQAPALNTTAAPTQIKTPVIQGIKSEPTAIQTTPSVTTPTNPSPTTTASATQGTTSTTQAPATPSTAAQSTTTNNTIGTTPASTTPAIPTPSTTTTPTSTTPPSVTPAQPNTQTQLAPATNDATPVKTGANTSQKKVTDSTLVKNAKMRSSTQKPPQVACPFCNATLPQDTKSTEQDNKNTPKDDKKANGSGKLVACPFCNSTLPQDSKSTDKDGKNGKISTQIAMDTDGDKNDESNKPTPTEPSSTDTDGIDESSNQTIDRDNQAALS